MPSENAISSNGPVTPENVTPPATAYCAEKVLREEATEIAEQRRLRGVPTGNDVPKVGLALSGGGIRSATFALGVLQVLSRLKLPGAKGRRSLVEYIDYLSTVSGGGYIGSWFVANRRRAMLEQGKPGTGFAINDSDDQDDTSSGKPPNETPEVATEEVAHLRRYSHYLTPQPGLMSADTWTMVTIWFRNTVLIQAMVFCVVACCFMLPHLWLRLVNGVPWLLNEIGAGPHALLGNSFVCTSFRWIELAFPAAVLTCFWLAYRQAKTEILMYVRDKKVDSGEVDKTTIQPIGQNRVQKRIVLPAVIAALLMTAWLWLHHERLSNQIGASPKPSEGVGFWEVGRWWAGWECQSVLWSPWTLIMTIFVVLMAHRLMWLKEDVQADGGFGRDFWKKTCSWHLAWWKSFLGEAGPPRESNPLMGKVAASLSLLRVEGLRRILFYLSLLGGSLFSLYVIDEAFRALFETKIAFKQHAPAVHLELEIAQASIHADYAPSASSPGFDIGIGLVAALGPVMMVLKYILMLVLALGLSGRRMFDNVREWWSRVGAWLLIYSLAMLAVCGIALFGPLVFDWIGDRLSTWAQGGVITGWLATLLTTLILGKGEQKSGVNEEKKPVLNLDNAALVAVLGLLFGGAWIVRFMLTPEGFSPQGNDPLLIKTLGTEFEGWWRFLGVYVGLIAVGAALIWRVDLNEFSMNHFYRNRLVRGYLGGATHAGKDRRPHPFTGFEFRDDKALAAFTSGRNYPGPYPLINTSLNTSQGGDLDVQERKAESFLLSPLFCGSSRRRVGFVAGDSHQLPEGYRRTTCYMTGEQDVPKVDQDPDTSREAAEDPLTDPPGIKIGTAMSISGAAASPNSGYHTSPVLAFLMTIFNVRLGWWVPNPAKDDWKRQFPAFPGYLKYLSFELFGSATPDSAFVYLSDGGHFENLGIYELVRRSCRFVIAIDGEEDGDFTFHALGTAIRRCRVDFDAEIEICVDDIRPDPATGLSRSHCAVGRIRYPDKSEGTLLYIKSSLTGDEATDIAQYKKISPAFPHESTIDQFFSESQFESYRKLGQTACHQAFAPLKRVTAAEPSDPTEELRKELAEYWHGSTKDFTDHTDCLDEIWASVASDDLPECVAEIVLPRTPATTFSKMPDDEFEQRQVIAFGQRLIQLMENVCLDLQPSAENPHPDHTGWIELFKGWVAHPVMQILWTQSQSTYGKRFAHFWDELLRINKLEQAQAKVPERREKKPSAKPKRTPRKPN